MRDVQNIRGIAFALLGAICWGFSATCVRYLTDTFSVNVLWLAFARTIIAGPVFLVIAAILDKDRLKSLLKDRRMLVQVAVFAVVGVICMQVTYMSAVKYLGAGNALLLQETGLVLIMLHACIRERRLPKKRELASLLLAFFGTAAIATQGDPTSLGISLTGLLWGLAAGAALAGYNIVPIRLLNKYGSLVVNGYSMTLAAIALIPIARPWQTYTHMPTQGWLVFIAVVVVGTILAYIVYLQGVKEAGAVNASLIAVFEPISGMFFSAIWLGEGITLADLIGCVAIVAMMITVALPEKTKKVEPQKP